MWNIHLKIYLLWKYCLAYEQTKYTFYVCNVGRIPAKYDFKVNIENSVASEDGRFLDDTLRVMIYENGKKTIYGKEKKLH